MDRRRWHYLTRQPGFILRSVLLVLLVGVAGAWLAGSNPTFSHGKEPQLHAPREPDEDDGSEGIPEDEILTSGAEFISPLLGEFTKHPLTEDRLIEWLRGLRTNFRSDVGYDLSQEALEILMSLGRVSVRDQHAVAQRLVALGKFPDDREALFQQATDAIWLTGKDRQTAERALEAAAKADPPVARAAELLAEAAMAARNFPLALESYRQAAKMPEPGWSHAMALQVCIRQKMTDHLRALRAQPGFAEAWRKLPSREQEAGALLLGNYGELLTMSAAEVLAEISSAPIESSLTFLCGLIWFLMLHQLGGVALRGNWRSVVAVLLGMLSPIITLFFITLQERLVGLHQSGDFVNDLLFYTVGVGLREELSKLILFAPLLWWLRNKSEAEILVTAGCVGLGFAIEENINYFAGFGHAAVLPRFISANFMHVALTGLGGLALARWCRFPRSCWEQSLFTILAMILVHGGYDFCIGRSDARGIMALDFFATVILMLLAFGYCQELRRVRLAKGNLSGPLWTFLFGISILSACALVASSHLLGLDAAVQMIYKSGLDSALLIILFGYQLHDL